MAAPSLPTLVVGGVPEHFNSPVVLGIRNGTFAKHGINVEWKEVPEGTGKMCSMLRDGSLDVALILTEGIVRDIVQGSQAKIVATFIETPLTWAVCASPSTADSVKSIDDLRGKTVGISRYGSGSHLMACVLADDKQWSVERGDFKFDTFDNFVGLRKAVNSGAATAFLWDTFMTKPYCDSGELRKIGEVITPWPCFMVAANADVLSSRWSAVPPFLAALQESAHAFITGGAESLAHLQKNFRLTHDDAVKWMGYTKYSVKGEISRKVLIKTVDVLVRAKMLPPYESKFSFFRFYDSRASIATVDSEEIRTMKLYYDTRVRNELQARGKLQGPLTVEDLVGFDQLHYHGTEAVDYAARTLGFKAGEHVLDVGAGVGGPARYMAAKHGVRVTALEIEPSRVRVADELVERCGLSSLVHVVCADATKYHAPAHVDHIVSWLAILHIRDRLALFRRLLACLRPGGNLLIEDFVQLAPFSASELSALHVAIACPLCPTKDEYVSHLTHAGFVDVHTEDISADWRAFVLARVQNFEATRAQITATHGEEIANGLGYFFGVIADLFASGHLGGIRVVAKRAA